MLGVVFILFTALLTGSSYIFYIRNKTNLSLASIILLALVLRIYCSLDPMLHEWDERYHALVSKNMIDNPFEPKLYKKHLFTYNFKNWTSSEIWLHKQPVPLWVMALSMKIFGVNEFTLRLPSIILSTICVFLTFLIGKSFYNERIGLFSAFFHAVNGLILDTSSGRVATDHIDTFFLFFIEVSILFLVRAAISEKRFRFYLILAGISCGLAILTKWLPALIIFPLFLILNYQSRNFHKLIVDLTILAAVIVAVFLPWQLYAWINFPNEYIWAQHFNYLHISEALEGHGRPWYYFVNMIRINVNELIYAALIWFLFTFQKSHPKTKENAFILTWILIPFIFFSAVKTKMQAYILFTFPAYFILLGLFVENIKKESLTTSSNALRIVAKALVFLIFFLAIRYGIERMKPFNSKEDYRCAKKELLSLEFPNQSVLFNIPCPIEAMFYSNCIAYPFIPNDEQIDELFENGFKLYVVDDGKLSKYLIENKKVEKIKLQATMRICQ